MSGKAGGPPKGQAWVWQTRDLLSSAAWRSLGINARRLIDFLLIEHMSHGGKENGRLLAPRRQLWKAGIGNHFVSEAIEEAVALGIVDVKRGIGRLASTYTLNWLPLHDGTMPVPRWLNAVSSTQEHSLQMSAKEHSDRVLYSTHKAHSECPSALTKPVVSADSGSAKQHSPSRRRSYHSGGISTDVEAGEPEAQETAEQVNGAGQHPTW